VIPQSPSRILARQLLAPLALLALLLPGCAVWPGGATPMPEVEVTSIRKDAAPASGKITRQELRFRLERVADSFYEEIAEPLDEIINGEANLERRRIALEAKYIFGSNAILIASGPYPAVSMLDMVVFLTLSRMMVEDVAVQALGPAGRAVIDVARKYEQQGWNAMSTILDAEQQQQLRELIDDWRAAHPNETRVEGVRFNEFAGELDERNQQRASGLLSDVRNATRTADQALELGERLTYFFQRAPLLWRMHAHIAFLQIVSHPEAQGVLADARGISESADRLSRSAELLTSVLTQGPTPEQEAFFANLDEGEQRLRGLMAEARETMAAANELATSADALAVRFDLGGPPQEGDEPFDIADYQVAAHDFSAMAVELRSLVESLNTLLVSPTLSERLPTAVDAAQSGGEELVRYAVILALAVILATIFSTLIAMLGYRYLTARLVERLERRHPPTAT
jgi:hypothetical protein